MGRGLWSAVRLKVGLVSPSRRHVGDLFGFETATGAARGIIRALIRPMMCGGRLDLAERESVPRPISSATGALGSQGRRPRAGVTHPARTLSRGAAPAHHVTRAD